MHDITDLEDRGTPSVFVASSEFIDAAEAQAKALGFVPESVFVAHPIQDANDDQMRGKADDVVDAVVQALSDKV